MCPVIVDVQVGRPSDPARQLHHVRQRNFNHVADVRGVGAVTRPRKGDVGPEQAIADPNADQVTLRQRAEEPAQGRFGQSGALVELMQRATSVLRQDFEDRDSSVNRAVFEAFCHDRGSDGSLCNKSDMPPGGTQA